MSHSTSAASPHHLEGTRSTWHSITAKADPASNPYAPLMGRTFVDLDETGAVTVLDEDRAATLGGVGGPPDPRQRDRGRPRPSSTRVAYIDAILRKAPTLRPVILGGIDALDAAARSAHGAAVHGARRPTSRSSSCAASRPPAPRRRSPSSSSSPTRPTTGTRACRPSSRSGPGFDVRNTVVGKPMKPFPVDRLETISTRPDHFRSVSA